MIRITHILLWMFYWLLFWSFKTFRFFPLTQTGNFFQCNRWKSPMNLCSSHLKYQKNLIDFKQWWPAAATEHSSHVNDIIDQWLSAVSLASVRIGSSCSSKEGASASLTMIQSNSTPLSNPHSDSASSTPVVKLHPLCLRVFSELWTLTLRVCWGNSDQNHRRSDSRRASLTIQTGCRAPLVARRQKNPGSWLRRVSPHRIISARYRSLYGPGPSSWSRSRPCSWAYCCLRGPDSRRTQQTSDPKRSWIRSVT